MLPTTKNLKWLMYITNAVVIITVTYLLWIYKPLPDSLQQFIFSPVKLLQSKPQRCDPAYMASLGQGASFVEVNRTLLISAYMEHRTGKKEVRVITVMLRSQRLDYTCIFCCQGYQNTTMGVSQIHGDHFDFPYGTADIMCPLPSGCETPSHIAVVTVAPKDEDELAFLEIQNQKELSDDFPYSVTVCLSTMFDFTNVLQLVQGIEMFQLLGVNRVAVYKTSCNPETQRILDYYTQKGLVDVLPWPLAKFLTVSRHWRPELGPGELHYFGQIAALTDCLYRYMYRSKYVAMHDIDELILPQSVNSLLELLPQLENDHGPDMCYKFENHIYPTNGMLPPPSLHTLLPQGCWDNVTGTNILNYLHRAPVGSLTMVNFKIIASPRAVFTPSVHGVLSSKRGCVWVDMNTARLYHTRAQGQTWETLDQLTYDDRLLNYSPSLIPAVSTVLKECGFLPKNSTC